jgi:DNA helicase HerA-like ATPase
MIETDPTYLGKVAGVSGASITVRLAESLSSGLAIIAGRVYRVAQVGSFVRIPQGYQDLYGVVCEVGASAAPTPTDPNSYSGRWMRVELAGESVGAAFERGLSRHPNIDDTVHIVTEADLARIYGQEDAGEIPIGTLSSAENIIVRLSLDKLVTRHAAIIGSTGAGKSTTVASLLRSIIGSGPENSMPASRILVLDIHGEYSVAMADVAKVFSATPRSDESPLYVPYWALEAGEILAFLAGDLTENHEVAFTDKIQELKSESLANRPLPGLELQSLTVDAPVPFSLKRLWYDLIDFETTTFVGDKRDEPALEEAGDPDSLKPPKYRPHAMGTAGPFLNQAARGIRRPLNLLRSRLLDRRYDFLLHPGPWEPSLSGETEDDLDVLLEAWLGHDRQLTILDLSGVPSTVLVRLIGSILRIVYEALFWSREKTEGGVLRPLLIVMEEAHRYVGSGAKTAESDTPTESKNVAASMVQRIAKEGRKYGVGALLVSQRPAEIDETVLSQCGTLIALRLSNPNDRARVKGSMPDNLAGLTDLLPVLRTGEALIVGEAARLPVRCRVTLPVEEHRPRSSDPEVAVAWSKRRLGEGYDRVVASWRAQRPTAVAKELKLERKQVTDSPAEGSETEEDKG